MCSSSTAACDMIPQALKLTGNDPGLRLPFEALAALPALTELHVDREVRQRMLRDRDAAPLLHHLRF